MIKPSAAVLPTPARPCLIVSPEKVTVFHHGSIDREYRDSVGLAGKQVKSKYSERDITKLMRSGVRVVVLNSGEVHDTREVCEQ